MEQPRPRSRNALTAAQLAYITALRQRAGLTTDTALAAKLGINSRAVNKWVGGTAGISPKNRPALAAALRVDYPEFESEMARRAATSPRARVTEVGPTGVVVDLPQTTGHADHALLPNIPSTSPKPLPIAQDVTYPIAGATGIAGLVVVLRLRPSDMHGGGQGEPSGMIDTTQYVAVFVDRPPVAALEAVRITGRCMEPEIRQGDVVIVDTSRRWHARDGDVVAAVLIATQERIVRRLERAGTTVRLVADASGYEVIEVPGDQVELLGVVTHSSHLVQRRRPPLRLNGHPVG